MKKIFCFLLLVLFTVTSVCSVNAASVISDYEIREQRQALALYEFDKLWNDEQDSYLFSTTFGGAYFDANDILHINFKSDFEQEILNTYNFEEMFEFGFTRYSIKELHEAINIILEYSVEYSISRVSIDDTKNSIIVTTKSNNGDLKNILVKMLNIENILIEYEASEYETLYTYSITNGDFYLINGYNCTVGFAARNADGDAGFVTAGHCVSETGSTIGEDIVIDGNTVGDVDSYIFQNYSSADVAFIDLRSEWWWSPRWIPSKNLVFNNSYQYLNTSSSYPVVGTAVAYYGDGNHSSIQYGEVTTSSMNAWVSGTLILNLVETDIVLVGGDSGGPFVRTIYAGGGQYYKYVQGVLSGGNAFNSVYSTVYNIFDELDLSSY